MNKARKKIIYITLAIIIIASGSAAFYYFKIKPDKLYSTPLINALPANTIAYYKGKDFMKFYDNMVVKSFWQNLATHPAIASVDNQIRKVDSLVSANPDIKTFLHENEIILSLHKTTINTTDILLLTRVGKKFSYEDLPAMIKTKKKYLFVKRTFMNEVIYDYQLTPQKSLIAFAFKNGILMLSPNTLLIEDAIRTLYKNGTQDINIPHWSKPTSNENLFINFSQTASFLELFTRKDIKKNIDWLNNFAGIGLFEADFKKDYVYLRGRVNPADSIKNFIFLFNFQKPKKTEIYKIIPERTSILFSFNIDHMGSFYENRLKQIKAENKWSFYETNLKLFEDKTGLNIKQDILPLLEGHYSYLINEPVSANISTCRAVIIRTKDTDKAIKVFGQFDEEVFLADSSGKDFKAEYKGINVYKSTITDVFGLLYGKMFSGMEQSYFINIRDYLIFSTNLTNLKRLADDYLDDKCLANSPEFNKFSEKMISETNFLMYLNPMRSANLPDIYCDPLFINQYKEARNYFNNFNFFVFDISSNKNIFYSELIASYTSNTIAAKEDIWSVELEAPLAASPYSVKNTSTDDNDIILQDESGVIYLVAPNGEITWKRKPDHKLVGDIAVIDLFNNNKKQFLIATTNQICLFDRNGKNAGSYPIKTAARVTTGICLVDDDKGKELKYFVGCEKNTIYGFEKNGNPLEGWNPKTIQGPLAMPLKTFSKSGKSYIFGITTNGKLSAWDLKGKELFKTVDLGSRFNNPFFMVFGKDFSSTNILSIDTSGNTWFINLEGVATMQKSLKKNPGTYLLLTDLDNNGKKEILYIDKKAVTAHTTEGRLLYSFVVEDGPGRFPEIVRLKNKNYLAFLNTGLNKLLLLDSKGKTVENFPVPAHSGFTFYDANRDNKPELLRSIENIIYLSRF